MAPNYRHIPFLIQVLFYVLSITLEVQYKKGSNFDPRSSTYTPLAPLAPLPTILQPQVKTLPDCPGV
ncbi:hypothetical protein MFRU_007g00850 [Monilinia fructicola]|nr:hypothetical protein MFRU_007g00850 [Monilinia fructicola]